MRTPLEPSLALITAPTDDVVTVAEVKKHAKIDHGDDDALIPQYIAAAVAQLDAAAGGWLGRALRPQTWELRQAQFPCGPIWLPYPPFIEIVSVKYDDSDGVEQALALGTGYRVLGFTAGDLPPKWKIAIAPPYGMSWPSARCDYQSVRVRWKCGYAPKAAVDPGPAHEDYLPADIRAWLFLVFETLYENRASAAAGELVKELPSHILNMLEKIRVRS